MAKSRRARKSRAGAVEVTWNGDVIMAVVDDKLDHALYEGASVLQRAAMPRIPVATGKLLRSGYAASATKDNYAPVGKTRRKITPRRGTAVAAFSAFYAPFLESGARRHVIKPRRRKYLYFNGRFARRVKHPGVQGRHIMSQAYAASQREINEAITVQLRKELERGVR
jgi:hypothetical protein